MDQPLAPPAHPDPGQPGFAHAVTCTSGSVCKGSSSGLYALQLIATEPGSPGRLRGRIEHVLSGRRHDFDSGDALLACLALEQHLQVSQASQR